jgi:hypothetical protein
VAGASQGTDLHLNGKQNSSHKATHNRPHRPYSSFNLYLPETPVPAESFVNCQLALQCRSVSRQIANKKVSYLRNLEGCRKPRLTNEAQKKTLAIQNRGLHRLKLIGLDRTLGGIEISYTPSADEWKTVMKVYPQLVPNIKGESSYYGAP